MKKLAKLALFFSLSFAIIFLAAAGMRFLELRVDWVRTLPQGPETILTSLIAAAFWALSLALYGALLLSLSYAVRGRIFTPVAAPCLFVLALALGFGVFTSLERWGNVPAAKSGISPLGGPGLMLANSLSGNETTLVLLKGPLDPKGPRVAVIPGRPLLFQEAAPVVLMAAPGLGTASLPPVPFRNETPWFLKSLAIDLRLSAEQLSGRYAAGLASFLLYAGALVFCLTSLRFILHLSAWPLANLFLGCLVFRGVLALETFFNSPDMQNVFGSFLGNRISVSLAVPLIFGMFGVLVYLYSVLVYLAKRRDDDED